MVNKGGVSVRVADIGFDDETYSHAFYKEHLVRGVPYIKVATGEQFIVIVDISPDFNFMGCPEVEIRCTIDDEDVKWALSAVELARLRAQHNMRRINFFDTERFIDGRWMRCALSFGELRVDDSVHWTPGEVFRQSVDRGCIRVQITRGSSQLWGPEPIWPHECATDVKTVSSAAMEDSQISHALEAVPFEECRQPWQDWHFVPAILRTGSIELYIHYASQEALELLGIAPDEVKNEVEDRKDPTIKAERAPVKPKLEAEAVIKIEDGDMDLRRPPVKSEAAKSRRKKPLLSVVKQEQEQQQEQNVAISGKKRKRAATKPTSTSKKVKCEEPSVDPEPEQEGPSSRTRSKARAKAEASDAASMSKAPTNPTKVASGQQGDDDEVEFLSSRPVRRVVGRYDIDD